MSGLFKNYDKFVNAAVFASANKLIVNPSRWSFNSANLFYNPTHRYTGLPQGHEYTAFSLASIASALTSEAQQFSTVEGLSSEAQLNYQFSAQCAREAIQFVKNNTWNQEVEINAQLLYVLANNNLLKDVNKEVLLPNIIANAKYLSTQNIVDIVTSLQDYKDTTFWTQFFTAIKGKQFSWELHPVDYHAWTTVQFDYLETVKQPFRLTNTWAVLKSGDSQVKRFLFEGVLFGYTNFWLPFVQREKRIRYVFDDRQVDRDAFKKALKTINEVYDVKDIIAKA